MSVDCVILLLRIESSKSAKPLMLIFLRIWEYDFLAGSRWPESDKGTGTLHGCAWWGLWASRFGWQTRRLDYDKHSSPTSLHTTLSRSRWRRRIQWGWHHCQAWGELSFEFFNLENCINYSHPPKAYGATLHPYRQSSSINRECQYWLQNLMMFLHFAPLGMRRPVCSMVGNRIQWFPVFYPRLPVIFNYLKNNHCMKQLASIVLLMTCFNQQSPNIQDRHYGFCNLCQSHVLPFDKNRMFTSLTADMITLRKIVVCRWW